MTKHESRRGRAFALLAFLSLGAPASGCRKEHKDAPAQRSLEPRPIGHAECAACGMVVIEQPAPRMQVVHRDGHRAYFCSIGDSLHYLADRNSHGEATAVYVEVLPEEVDAKVLDTKEKDWALVSDTVFVTGIERSGIMGEPVLAFRSASAADAVAKRAGGRVGGWMDVQRRLLGDDRGSQR